MATSAILDEDGTNYFEEARKELFNKSILVSKLWLVPTIIGCYLVFIFFGNRIMEKRNPFHLKLPMVAYNIFQVSYNLYIFYRCMDPQVVSYYISHTCHPMDPSKNELWYKYFGLAYLFAVLKLLDLMDTVFLVLRKKTKQMSFLHLYHHTFVATISWVLLNYYSMSAEQTFITVMLNSLIHAIMYLYYLLSLLGPSFQKYLWWKKYLTVLQLVQFMIYIGYILALLAYGCTQPKSLSLLVLFQGIIFLALFRNFYNRHYKCSSSSALKSTALPGNKKKQ